MRHKLVLWLPLLLAGFLIGFTLQYSRLQRVQQELSASTKHSSHVSYLAQTRKSTPVILYSPECVERAATANS